MDIPDRPPFNAFHAVPVDDDLEISRYTRDNLAEALEQGDINTVIASLFTGLMDLERQLVDLRNNLGEAG